MQSKEKPYVLYVAEVIYTKVCEIKKKNSEFSNINAVEIFIGSKTYKEKIKGQFHYKWFKRLKKNNFIDQKTKKKIPDETIRLLQIQKDVMIKQLVQFPNLYHAKSYYPLKISQRAFDHLWRVCESYEMWCKETKQKNLIRLKL